MRIIILICVFISLIVIGFGGWYVIHLYKTGTATKPERIVGQKPVSEGTPFDAIPEFEKRCGDQEEDVFECAWLKGLVVAQTVEALQDIEYSRDQRGVSSALEALDLEEEPEVQIAAIRVLAQFPDNPEIASKVGELLLSPYLEVQRTAAQLITRSYNTNAALGGLGYQWSENHGGLPIETPYEELEIPAHYSAMGFPDFPNAARFPPGDSDRSIGWITPDSASVVENELSTRLGVKAMGYDEWYARQQQALTSAFRYDPAAMAEIEKLMEQYTKTQDQKILDQIQARQKKMAEPFDQAAAKVEKGLDRIANPPHGIPPDTIRYFVIEEREGSVLRAIVMYPHPALNKTVIQMVWNLNEYEAVWPALQ